MELIGILRLNRVFVAVEADLAEGPVNVPVHGPDEWQRVFLQDLGALLSEFGGINPVDPIQMAVASGHGIGKSTLIAWLHWWIMCTRPNSPATGF